MKKYLKLLFVALFATMTFAFTACGDDDDEPDGNYNIVGTWESLTWEDYTSEITFVTKYIRFYEDGKCLNIYSDNEPSRGNWKVDGNKLIISGGDFSLPTTAIIKSVTKDKLVIEQFSITMEFKRVSDSVIDKYL